MFEFVNRHDAFFSYLFLGLGVAYVVAKAAFLLRLRTHEPAFYESLGRPTLFGWSFLMALVRGRRLSFRSLEPRARTFFFASMALLALVWVFVLLTVLARTHAFFSPGR